jgi:hypothetical protein
MAVELVDFVAALKREVQPPGSDIFADVGSSEWVGYLSDAFWEARLDGFLAGYQTDEGSVGTDIAIIPVSPELPDLDRRGMALIILYAGVKVLRNRILNMNTQFRAKAGPVEFEQQNSATMLAEMLKQLKATKDRIIEALDTDSTDVIMLDAYSTRVYSVDSYHGAPELSGGL